MIRRVGEHMLRHIKHYLPAYILFFMVFFCGFIIGIFSIYSLENTQTLEMKNFLDQLFNGFAHTDINSAQEVKNNLIFNGSFILVIWFLGLSVIGVPLILPVLFYKGYTLGFCIAFILANQPAPGLLVLLLSIIPQALVILPLIFLGALAASLFSLRIIRGYGGAVSQFLESFGSYSIRFVALFSGIFVCALFEGYLSPLILKVIFNII